MINFIKTQTKYFKTQTKYFKTQTVWHYNEDFAAIMKSGQPYQKGRQRFFSFPLYNGKRLKMLSKENK